MVAVMLARNLDDRYDQWYDCIMSQAKVAVSIDEDLLKKVDNLVKKNVFSSRSQAIQIAIEDKLSRLHKTRLAQECAKLDPSYEQSLAEEGLSSETAEWPEY